MRHSLFLLLALVGLLVSPGLAQKSPLQVTISVTNGATDAASVQPEDMPTDNAIRVFVSLDNQSGKKVKVTRIACTFFDTEGHQLAQDQAQPLELRGRAKGSAVLFYANPAAIFAFKAVGVIDYEQDGQTFSTPINVDQSQVAQPDKNGVNY